MKLPKKDKNGKYYLSYSQISLFKRSKEEYYDNYILNKPFKGNAYTDFGTKVGSALENNLFSMFDDKERKVLSTAKRLDVFERRTFLNYEGFYVIGFIDSIKEDMSELLDYKTGGIKKEKEYTKESYTQLQLYALSIRQETGITPSKASVEFIRRKGNAFKGEVLKVAEEPIITIDVDISIKRLTSVYWDTLNTAKQISDFYMKNKI